MRELVILVLVVGRLYVSCSYFFCYFGFSIYLRSTFESDEFSFFWVIARCLTSITNFMNFSFTSSFTPPGV